MTGTRALSGLVAAVIGGDGRELEILKELRSEGATVRACGTPHGAEAILGGPQSPTLMQAIAEADLIVAPVPLLKPGAELYAPEWPQPLHLDDQAFSRAKRGALLIIGTSTPQVDAIAAGRDIRVRAYGEDPELMILRAPTVAEGALAIAIENTDVSIHGADVLVVGFGRIGSTMTRVLLVLGAHVTVAARDPLQRARAWEIGAMTVHVDDLEDAAGSAQMIFNTAPAPLLTEAVLARVARDTFILDMAGAPGGTDFEAAARLGIRAVLGRGLGKRAPKTAGRSQWRGIRAIIAHELGR